MSSYQYKTELARVLGLLSASTRSAAEWKKVAENRLSLIKRLDDRISDQVSALIKVGTIFGVDGEDPGYPRAYTMDISGDEAANLALQKIMAVSSFTANLTREAVSLQKTLNDTLALAMEAQMVAPPSNDLDLSFSTESDEDVSLPIKEVYQEVEKSNDSDDEPMEDQTALVLRKKGIVTMTAHPSLNDLF